MRGISCVTIDVPLAPQLYRAIALDSRRFTLGTFHITEALDQPEPKGLVAVENAIPSALYADQPTPADLDFLAKSIDSTIKIAAYVMHQYLNDHGGRPYQPGDWGALLFASEVPD